MEKLAGLGWTEALAFSTFGIRVGIRINCSGFLEPLCRRFVFPWKPLPAGSRVDHLYSLLLQAGDSGSKLRNFHLAYSGSVLAGRSLDPEETIARMLSDLDRHIAEFSR